jgi:hypothetical protein
LNKKIIYPIAIIIFTIIIALNVNASVPPFNQCVQLLDGLGNPITSGTCYMTDNATIYNNALMNNMFDGTYCLTINNSFSQGTYSFVVTCYYQNTTGMGAGTFAVDNCTENWILESPNCQIDNTYTKTYVDHNSCGTTSNLPADNGTTDACNYCSQNIYQNTSECTNNGTQTITYFDNNYASCCYITGLPEDCMILEYPYNDTTSQGCFYYQQQINCTMDSSPVLNTKINVNCVLPSGNEEYCCVINTYQGNNLLATSPEYSNPSQSILSIASQSETRTCFSTTNKLLNAYYTTKELRPDTNYTIEILCNNNQTSIKTQRAITPVYHEYDWLTLRLKWLGDNLTFTLLTIPIVIALILFGIFLVRKIRGR